MSFPSRWWTLHSRRPGAADQEAGLTGRGLPYLLLAGVLFADLGWKQVHARPVSGLAEPVKGPSASALSEAMRRVGTAPLRELFTLVKGPAVCGAQQMTRFAGRLVVAIDGTQIAVADTEATAMRLPVVDRLVDGSFLSHAGGRQVRVIDAALTITTEAETRTTEYRLVTTMLDPLQAPAHAVARLYHQRWGIETEYCELNHTFWAAGYCAAGTRARSSSRPGPCSPATRSYAPQ